MGPEPHALQAKETQGQGGKVTHPRSHGSLVTDLAAEGGVGAAWLGLPGHSLPSGGTGADAGQQAATIA